jgi:hypothetical protein
MPETFGYKFAAIAACCACAVAPPALSAADSARLEVRKGDCKSGVNVTARGVRLSEVLGKLSETLEFQYRFEGERDPVLDLEIARQPVELVKALARDQNLTLIQARDRACPNRDRIVRVWVLPKGNEGAARARPAPAPVISPEAQKAYEDYLSAHGMRLGPDGREETIPPDKQ